MKVTKSNTPTVKYYLSPGGNGIVSEGQVLRIREGSVTFSFDGAVLPDGVQMVLNSEKGSYYRYIKDNRATLDSCHFVGKITLAVTVPRGAVFHCEPLYAIRTDEELVLLVYDVDCLARCRELEVASDKLASRLAAAEEENSALKKRLDEYMEHWDII